MNYNEINKSIGKSKLAKIFGWIFLIAGVLMYINESSAYLNWKLKEENYNKQYAYSNYGDLYYEMNNTKVYIEKIYDTSGEIIELEVPNQKTVIMYCSKNNMNECIYFDMNTSMDYGLLNPFMFIVINLILIAMGLFLVIKKRVKIDEHNQEKASLDSIYMFFVFLFALGASTLIWQIYSVVNRSSLKNDSNVATATIYSEIYKTGGDDEDRHLYKPVSYYYVDNQKYIYVNDFYIRGYLEDNLGKTFELYYNKNKPSEAYKKEDQVNFLLLFMGIGLVIFSFPFVFFKGKMEKRIDKDLAKQKNQEWKI